MRRLSQSWTRGRRLSYHTPTQECLVAKDGVDTCTDFYQIPAGFSQGKTVTGTLKVGAAVTSISDYAFAYTDLTELHLSEATALLTIGDAAFYGNAQLTGTLKVGPAVLWIGGWAFAGTGYTGIDLSEATAFQTIGRYAFYSTPLAGQTVFKADGTPITLS